MTRFLWMLALPLSAAAQVAPVDVVAPTVGYVYDAAARAVRPIEGVPGAALLSAPVHLDAAPESTALAPDGRYGLALLAGRETLAVLRLDGATGVLTDSPLLAWPAFFSPSGRAVALLAPDRIETWTGLPEQPVRGLSLERPAEVDSLVVSDDGSLVLALGKGRAWRVTADGTAELAGQWAGAAFLKQRQDLLALRDGALLLLPKGEPGNGERGIAVDLDGASGLVTSGDDRWAALGREGEVVLVDLETGAHSRFALPQQDTPLLLRGSGPNVFLAASPSLDIAVIEAGGLAPRLSAVIRKETE